MDNRPIGIFDSGVGGLTVADKVFRLLPNEKVIYFGDTARVPYGNKSGETVTRFSKEIAKFLLGFKVKLIIVACNTASSLGLGALKRSISVPVVGVIKPGAEEALRLTKKGRIGVIGTQATVKSNAYKNELKAIDKRVFVAEKACPLFVPLVENKWINDEITRKIARRYLAPLLDEKIDTLILGCTHYPPLKKVIGKITGKGVRLVDSSTAVTKYTKEVLRKRGLLADGKKETARFFASDDTKNFADLAKIFLGKNIKAKRVVF